MAIDTFIANVIKGIVVNYISKGGATIENIKNDFLSFVGEPLLPGYDDSKIEEYLHQIPNLCPKKDINNNTVWFISIKRNNGNVPEAINTSKIGMKRKLPPEENNNIYGKKASISIKNNQKKPFEKNYMKPATNEMRRENKIDTAMFHDYHLVGDDFFLNIATIELESRYIKKGKIRQCGLCISGQSIRAATRRLSSMPNMENSKVIINVGSIDILHGHDLVDMRFDYKELINVCNKRNIKAVITTLPPLANRNHSPDEVDKLRAFNQFLYSTFAKDHYVIDIRSCMVNRNGRTNFDFYHPQSKYVTGSNQPHVLWNRLGRERILRYMKRQIVHI